MPYTVRGLLNDHNCRLEDSVYAGSSAEMLDFQIYSRNFYELGFRDGKGILRFKNSADVLDFDLLTSALPDLKNMTLESREIFPYCTENLEMIPGWLTENRETMAVEGGPCLFSENEVIAEVTDLTGRTVYFDYSEGEAWTKAEQGYPISSEESFGRYVSNHIGELASIHFRCVKTGLSPQEYLHLRMPFEIAAALGIRLVITLPDMSYQKYLGQALEGAAPEFRKAVTEEFDGILYPVADLYLDLVSRLQKHFRVRDLTIVHGRNRELLEKFYRERVPYIERNKILRNLTGKPEKLESLKDYISMPALPYYLHGSARVLEVNSAVEVDSFRKCMRAHKGTVEFACILFPELLSGDGIHTMYYAQAEQKQYGKYPEEFRKDTVFGDIS